MEHWNHLVHAPLTLLPASTVREVFWSCPEGSVRLKTENEPTYQRTQGPSWMLWSYIIRPKKPRYKQLYNQPEGRKEPSETTPGNLLSLFAAQRKLLNQLSHVRQPISTLKDLFHVDDSKHSSVLEIMPQPSHVTTPFDLSPIRPGFIKTTLQHCSSSSSLSEDGISYIYIYTSGICPPATIT